MKDIYAFDKADVLKADGCTEKDAERFLQKGTAIYSPEDFFSMLKDSPETAKQFGCSGVDEVIKKCKSGFMVGDTSFTEYEGVPCVIEYVL